MIEARTESVVRQDRLQEILLAYVELAEAGTPPPREEFIAQHPDYAGEIAEFLASYEQMNRLGAPLRHSEPGRPTLAIPPRKPLGDETEAPGVESGVAPEIGQLGDYRLLREIGRGGMGIVYEAEQISLRRRVALKVLPFAAGLDARQLQRFRNEAEAAAHLHHSHIVPVFAVGSERGNYYYAMQLIEGQSLAWLINHLSEKAPEEAKVQVEPAGSGLNMSTVAGLSTEHSTRSKHFFEVAARIGRQAAESLEYAHQMGVIHRDIKPANLMIDTRGEVWITDFGLAQIQSQVGLTMTGEMLGTLRYASPEQAMAKRGLVDHRTDIYSLGATLYELLTLTPVFDGRDRHALLHQIGFEEPRPPRAIDPSIPVELETIVLKSLAKNPAERYGSAQDFADDLQRFLEDTPIHARRPSVVDRVRKWMRRHPSVVGAAVVLLAFAVIGFAVSTAMIAREQRETTAAYKLLEQEQKQTSAANALLARQQKATKAAYQLLDLEQKATNAAYEREKLRAKEAEDRFSLAKRSVDEMIQFSEEELGNKANLQGLRKRLLQSALVYYQEFIEQRQDDPASLEELRETKLRVETILADLAIIQGAGRLFLLHNPSVSDELKLSKDQREKVGALREQGMKLFQEIGRLEAEERQRRFLEQARIDDAVVKAVLTKSQDKRLTQIALQLQGLSAFRDTEVVSALKLTPDQRRKIQVVEGELYFMPKGLPDRKDDFRKGYDFRMHMNAGTDRVLALLTPAQKGTWREMTGDPFVVAMSPPFFGAGGPPFGKGPGGPGGKGPKKGPPRPGM